MTERPWILQRLPSAPDLVANSDSGSSDTDNSTNDTTPAFSGTADAGSTVELFADGISLGTTTADANGDWSFTVADSNAFADDSFAITATASTGSSTSVQRTPKPFNILQGAPHRSTAILTPSRH